MNVKDLKKNDVIEYSKRWGHSDFDIDRDLVTMATDHICVFGGMFSYDLQNLILIKVWRENDNGEYEVIYELNDSKKHTIHLLKYYWDDTEYERSARFIAETEEEINQVIKEYEEKWKPKENCLIHIEGWQ